MSAEPPEMRESILKSCIHGGACPDVSKVIDGLFATLEELFSEYDSKCAIPRTHHGMVFKEGDTWVFVFPRSDASYQELLRVKVYGGVEPPKFDAKLICNDLTSGGSLIGTNAQGREVINL